MLKEQNEEFLENHTEEDLLLIRSYTGYQYKETNAILRGNWNYERNGLFTEEKQQKYLQLAADLKNRMSKNNSLSNNIKVYRRTSLSTFKEYGITHLEDLLTLKGQYFFDSGFTSTSFLRSNSFFGKEIEWHEECNIEIEYFILEEYKEGLPLIDSEFSYSVGQMEYVLKAGNLSKIMEVEINREKGTAYLKMTLIPEEICNDILEEKRENSVLK